MQKEEPTEHTEHTESSCQVYRQRQTRVHRLVCFRGEPSRPLWLNLFRVFRVFRGPTAFFQLHRSGLASESMSWRARGAVVPPEPSVAAADNRDRGILRGGLPLSPLIPDLRPVNNWSGVFCRPLAPR